MTFSPYGMDDTGSLVFATSLEGRLYRPADETSSASLASRTSSLETWRAAKATASPDVSTIISVPTAALTLGIQSPTAAGLNSLFSTVMGEVNGIKAVLRSREIMAY